ncbi:MAG: hypothetical protein R2911_30785 [Caldilineaceae bacterium]
MQAQSERTNPTPSVEQTAQIDAPYIAYHQGTGQARFMRLRRAGYQVAAANKRRRTLPMAFSDQYGSTLAYRTRAI